MRWVVFIGMGDNMVPAVRKARARGLRVVCANRDPEALTLQYADLPLVIDGRDVKRLLYSLVTQLSGAEIVDIYAGTELFVTVAILKSALGIANANIIGGMAGQHKALMRRMLSRVGLPIPKGKAIASLAEAERCAETLGLPAVVKPADNHSAVGVRVVATLDELAESVAFARKHSESGCVVFEEFVDGTLHDANGILIGGELVRLGIVDKSVGPAPARIVAEAVCPTALTQDEQESVYALLEESARALGFDSGPVKIDVIWGRDGPTILEVAPRFHGELGSLYLIPGALGIDLFDVYFRSLTGGRVAEAMLDGDGTGRYCVAQMIRDCDIARIAIRRLSGRQPNAGIDRLLGQQPPRDVLTAGRSPSSNREVAGYVIASGNTQRAVRALMEEFHRGCLGIKHGRQTR